MLYQYRYKIVVITEGNVYEGSGKRRRGGEMRGSGFKSIHIINWLTAYIGPTLWRLQFQPQVIGTGNSPGENFMREIVSLAFWFKLP